MELKEFVETFVCRNSLVRLWYPTKGGHEMVIPNDKKSACMDWEIIKGEGVYKKYLTHKVIGVTDIYTYGSYPEAINIVIEKIEVEDFRERQLNDLGI
jgi:hypothetical protein